VGTWTTAAVILARSGASSSPSPDDQEFAELCASAVNAGIDSILEDALVDEDEPEIVWLASMAGVEAYKRREAVFGITGYVDLQGAAIRVARDYLEAQRPILARYATPGLA
jgi:CMP-N-acetylneuraminic acid synthetase